MESLGLAELQHHFKGKRVFITGHTGFKGAWLTYLMHLAGATIHGFSLPQPVVRTPFHLLHLSDLIEHEEGDIRDYAAITKSVARFAPDVLFHLAAQPLVRLSYSEPKDTFDTNIGGSVNVLEAVRHSPTLRAVIYVTSDKCYKNREWVYGYREVDELGGHDPYSASKAVAELVFASYCDSFFSNHPSLGVASVRAGNVIGGGDWAADRIVPDCVRSLEANKPILVRNPSATRPWQHVLEPVGGYVLLASRLLSDPAHYSGAWNFGPRPESVRPVADLAQKIVEVWGSGEIISDPPAHAPHEARLLMLNCDKSQHYLGWLPRWDFATTLEKTVEWYRHVNDHETATSLTKAQVYDYLQ